LSFPAFPGSFGQEKEGRSDYHWNPEGNKRTQKFNYLEA